MSTNAPLHSSENNTTSGAQETSPFLAQRAHLVSEIAAALDTTLTHLNRLNRSLESVIGIGNEFSNVEALWSQFEGVMGNGAGGVGEKNASAGAEDDAQGGEERESGLESPPVARSTGFGSAGVSGR